MWLPAPGPYAQVAGQVLDLCDDSEALAAVLGRPLEPGEQAAEDDVLDVWMLRAGEEVECDVPGGYRYMHMSEWGFGKAKPTEQEAVEWRQQDIAENTRRSGGPTRWRLAGSLLGYRGDFPREFPLVEQDEVVVLYDTVSVIDGAVRGLVHNLSRTLYARDLEVAAAPSQNGDGQSSGDSKTTIWKWPLTVQPGERAPFEIEGWAGNDALEPGDLVVSASLSPSVDLKRSFAVTALPVRGTMTEDIYKDLHPDITLSSEEIPTGDFDYTAVVANLAVPHSPPNLSGQILGQEIQRAHIFAA